MGDGVTELHCCDCWGCFCGGAGGWRVLAVRRFSVAALAPLVVVEAESSPLDCFRLLLVRLAGDGAAADAMVPSRCCIVLAPACAVVAALVLRLLVCLPRPLPFLVEAEGENRSGGMLCVILGLALADVVAEAVLRDVGALEEGADAAAMLLPCSTSLPPLLRRDDRRTLVVLVVCWPPTPRRPDEFTLLLFMVRCRHVLCLLIIFDDPAQTKKQCWKNETFPCSTPVPKSTWIDDFYAPIASKWMAREM